MHDRAIFIITTEGFGCLRNVFAKTAANRRHWQDYIMLLVGDDVV